MTEIDEIKSRIDIVDLVSEAGVKLRRAGRNYTGFCPFHDNKKTPAFVVWPESGTWRCFGACNEGGDIFKFVMKREGIDFREALGKLAARAGIELKEYQRETPEQREAYDHLRDLLDDAVLFYRNHLVNNTDILTYLRQKRGLTDASIETFGLGYAPQGYDNALAFFTQRGYSQQDLLDAGLLTERDDGKRYDRFRHRIMIPIRDENGKMAGFGARIVDPNDIPKFLNSPETPVFSKGRLLYGLDRARKPIRAADQAVIVEGYLDVIALHQAGYENVVSPMGTALTEDQLRLLKRLTRRIVLALDPDTAGKVAVLRGLEVARQTISEKVPVFDEAGQKVAGAPELLRFADQLKVEIKVVTLPDDLDPDELVQQGKEEWSKLIDSAEPIVLHTMKSVVAKYDLNNPKDKVQIVEEIMPFISNVSDPVERDDYRQRLARMLRVDERSLISAKPKGPVMRRKPRGVESTRSLETPVVAAVNPRLKIEDHCLRVLLRKPELLYQLDRKLEEFGLIPLTVEDFEYTDHQLLFGVLRLAVEQDETDHRQYLVSHLPDMVSAFANDLFAQKGAAEINDDRLLEDLLNRFLDLRRTHAMMNVNQLRFLQEDEQEQGGGNIKVYQEQALQFTRLLRNLDQAKHRISKRQT